MDKSSNKNNTAREELNAKSKALENLSTKHTKLQIRVERREVELRSRAEEVAKLKKEAHKSEQAIQKKSGELTKMKEELRRQKSINTSLFKQQSFNKTEVRGQFQIFQFPRSLALQKILHTWEDLRLIRFD